MYIPLQRENQKYLNNHISEDRIATYNISIARSRKASCVVDGTGRRCGFSFGTFDSASNTLTVEDAVTFANYRVPIESRDAFRLDDGLGYRAGAAHVPEVEFGFDFGWVRIGDVPRRVYAAPNEQTAWVIPPSHPGKTEYLTRIDDVDSWFVQRIAAGDVERIGPIPATSAYERRGYQQLPPRKG